MRFFDAHCDSVMHIEDGDFDFVAGKGRSHMDLPLLLAAGHFAQVFARLSPWPATIPAAICALRRAGHRRHPRLGRHVGWADAGGAFGRRGEEERRSGGAREGASGSAGASSPPPLLSSAPLLAIIGLEGADPLEGQAENLRHFYDLGVRLVIPAWDDNAFSGSRPARVTG